MTSSSDLQVIVEEHRLVEANEVLGRLKKSQIEAPRSPRPIDVSCNCIYNPGKMQAS